NALLGAHAGHREVCERAGAASSAAPGRPTRVTAFIAMSFSSLQNHKGFFSDYWLGTILSPRGPTTSRLSAANGRRLLERLTRVADAIDGRTDIELTHFRERFARPILEELLGFNLKETTAEPRLRALGIHNGNGSSPLA